MTRDDIIEELDRVSTLFGMAARMVEEDELDIAISHLDEADAFGISTSGKLARDMIIEIEDFNENKEDED